MERRVPVGEAKARFAECVRRVEGGDTIVLTRHGRPVARLSGLEARQPPAGTRAVVPGRRSADAVFEPGPGYLAPGPTASAAQSRRQALERLLREEIWPRVPEEQLGRGVAKSEREKILGYGERGI